MEVRYGGYTGVHDLYVVTWNGYLVGNGCRGSTWTGKVAEELCVREKPLALQLPLQKYATVFNEELGMMEFSAKLTVKPLVKPCFQHPCSVPYALKETVKQELDHIERQGVIEKISHSDWAAPTVAVPKRYSMV